MPKRSGQKKKATQRRKGKANALPKVRTAFPCASRLTNDPSSVSDVVPSTSTCIPTTSSVNSNLGMSTVSTTCPKPKRTVTAETPLPPIGYFDSTSQQISTSQQLPQHACYNPVENALFTSPAHTLPQPPAVSSIPLPSFNSGITPRINRPNPYLGSLEVTLLHLCDCWVTTCHGCGQPIRSSGMLIPPPGDIVIVTKMRRDNIVGGEKRQGKLGNVYSIQT